MSQTSSADDHARNLAAASLADGSPTAWFESLYDAAGRGEAEVPWDRGTPHPMLSEWFAQHPEEATGDGRTAIVPGMGPGHDSEMLASLGFRTSAFDVAPSAVEQVRSAYPDSAVDYRIADLFELPDEWRAHFDLVVESMTVQSMPRDVRAKATAAVRSLVAPGGVLLVIGGVHPDDVDLADGPPWLLTHSEIEAFGAEGLALQRIEHGAERVRYRAEFRKARR
jgi:SAM-dependent methyltransferase